MFDEKTTENFKLTTNFKYGVSMLKNVKEKKLIINANRELLPLVNVQNLLINLLKKELKTLFKLQEAKKILVVGIGNGEIQTDSLGPSATKKIVVSRGLNLTPEVSVFLPDVFSNTGIETAEIVKSICEIVKPNVVVLIDSFSTNSVSRICSSFQVFEGGISAGSGVDAKNKQISKEFLNVKKVVSIGVPLLICGEKLFQKQTESEKVDSSFVLSPINIKKEVETISKIIALAINKALFNSLSKAEIESLIQ